jgi:hypothetical protein
VTFTGPGATGAARDRYDNIQRWYYKLALSYCHPILLTHPPFTIQAFFSHSLKLLSTSVKNQYVGAIWWIQTSDCDMIMDSSHATFISNGQGKLEKIASESDPRIF